MQMGTRNIEDLMLAEDDLGIDENDMLERYTLQKMTLEWLNWNTQFADYSEEPYLFYLSEILARDFTNNGSNMMYDSNVGANGQNFGTPAQFANFMKSFKNTTNSNFNPQSFDQAIDPSKPLDLYSPFRFLSNFATPNLDQVGGVNTQLENQLKLFHSQRLGKPNSKTNTIQYLTSKMAEQNFFDSLNDKKLSSTTAEKALAQRKLRRDYSNEKMAFNRSKSGVGKFGQSGLSKAANYLETNNFDPNAMELRDYYRKQTERALQDEESKKVFMIINSFGGSVGNGITVHDALQFIKAGSLTLALGVAASAASLALAGGTIGERYVTEGCHTMVHQPESSISGQASDIWIDSQEIMKIRLDVAEIYSLSTYRPRHKILRDLDRDFYLTATETVAYGLADEIATNEVMHDIIEMTSKVWDYHDTQQQRLLESRERMSFGLDTQAQS
jgi:ATP-dependent Clp protease protease subunit